MSRIYPRGRAITYEGYDWHSDGRTNRTRTKAERATVNEWEDTGMGDNLRANRLAYVEVLNNYFSDRNEWTIEEWSDGLNDLRAAFLKCIPEGDPLPEYEYELGLGEASEAEDEYVFRPLLLDDFGGDREAAENAWALGQRPAGYPEPL